jgi:hypothetical protein
VTLGVVAGLVLGKLVGILLGTGLAVRLRLGELAPGLAWLQLAGGAALSGIGFTISLFIVDLAFDDEALADQARVGVLAASVLAALLGWALFRVADRRRPPGTGGRPVLLDPPVDPARDHVRGPVDAPLTLVEYGDFECPFCGRATGTVEELRAHFGDRLRYVFRHVPLVDVHPHARLAAEAAEAAGAQGRFWELHDRLFADQDRLTAADLLEHAAAAGLDVPRFARDLGSSRFARRVEEDVESAEASGVAGTPTFFVNGRRHTGPFDTDSLAAALLAAAEGEGLPPAGDDDAVDVLDVAGAPLANNYGAAAFTNFASPEVRQYQVDLATEAIGLGFDEILYDYVRRPEGDVATMQFPGLAGPPDVSVARFVAETKAAIGAAPLGISVFGISASRPEPTAQDMELLAPNVDYIAPMVYPSLWTSGEYNVADPNGQPGEIVAASLADFQRVIAGSGAAIVPWLQDFNGYGPAQIQAQIEAARSVGAAGFMMWNAESTYVVDGLPAGP